MPPTRAPPPPSPGYGSRSGSNLRKVVEHVTVADIAGGRLPKPIDKLAEDPEAWVTR